MQCVNNTARKLHLSLPHMPAVLCPVLPGLQAGLLPARRRVWLCPRRVRGAPSPVKVPNAAVQGRTGLPPPRLLLRTPSRRAPIPDAHVDAMRRGAPRGGRQSRRRRTGHRGLRRRHQPASGRRRRHSSSCGVLHAHASTAAAATARSIILTPS